MSSRKQAWNVLNAVCLEQEYANLALRKLKLNPQDMAFVTQVVYGTLQNYRYVRYMWEDFASSKPKGKICVLLDMSVYQLLFLHAADYAIVNEAVKLAKSVYQGRYAKLVNAILHKVKQEPLRVLPSDPLEALGIQTSHPDWLIKMWNAQYGTEICEKICLHNLTIGKTWIRRNALVVDKEMFEEKMKGRIQSSTFPDAYVYCGKQLLEEDCYQDGSFAIADLSSQQVAYYVDPKPNEVILDVCSAPGGKACHMAALMENKGTIIACDLHEHRVRLIEEGARRLHVDIIQTKALDALHAQEVFTDGQFDRILCDVPCSGYGVLRGKSDIKYRMKSEDMDEIIKLQKQILECVCHLVKVGGTLVYSTCTLNQKENEKQVASFLKTHEEFVLEKQQTLFPYENDSDGFYMAKLIRKS